MFIFTLQRIFYSWLTNEQIIVQMRVSKLVFIGFV